MSDRKFVPFVDASQHSEKMWDSLKPNLFIDPSSVVAIYRHRKDNYVTLRISGDLQVVVGSFEEVSTKLGITF